MLVREKEGLPMLAAVRDGEGWSCVVTGEERGLLVRMPFDWEEEKLVLMDVRGGRVGRVERLGRVGRVERLG